MNSIGIFFLMTLPMISANLDDCPIKLEKIGCFRDDVNKRVFPEELLNERDPTSKVFGHRMIDWRNFETYLPSFACRCATVAFNKGYRVMGLQFYGECWSGLTAHLDYDKIGITDTCIDEKYKHVGNKPDCQAGTGTDSTNFVYRVAPTACDTYYAPVGCFHDNMIEPRPLPNYISNERDFSIPNWNRHLIDWKNWNKYSPEMICRCASLAKEKGYKMFAIQFWGECWSGNDEEIEYDRTGRSHNCAAANFESCPCNSYHCVGKARTNFVYKFIEKPKGN